jgi:hypothetical protein
MADPERHKDALAELRALVDADSALRSRLAGRSPSWDAVAKLLDRRLARAAAEAHEQGHTRVDAAAVVREIVESDLSANRDARSAGRRISECDELVLRRTEVSSLLATHHVSRRYAIEDRAGRELGEIQQVSNPARPVVAPTRLLALADLRFDVLDRTIGHTYRLSRAGEQLFVLDEVGRQLGFVHFKAHGAPPRSSGFRVISSLDRGMMQVRAQAERPFRLQIFDFAGGEVGWIDRRYVGLGAFSSDTNCIRVRVEPGRASPGQRLGLLATALLAGIDDETRPDLASAEQ